MWGLRLSCHGQPLAMWHLVSCGSGALGACLLGPAWCRLPGRSESLCSPSTWKVLFTHLLASDLLAQPGLSLRLSLWACAWLPQFLWEGGVVESPGNVAYGMLPGSGAVQAAPRCAGLTSVSGGFSGSDVRSELLRGLCIWVRLVCSLCTKGDSEPMPGMRQGRRWAVSHARLRRAVRVCTPGLSLPQARLGDVPLEAADLRLLPGSRLRPQPYPWGLHLLRVGSGASWRSRMAPEAVLGSLHRLACAHASHEGSPGTQTRELLWVCVR